MVLELTKEEHDRLEYHIMMSKKRSKRQKERENIIIKMAKEGKSRGEIRNAIHGGDELICRTLSSARRRGLL
jgi:hypothetical protein